MSADRSTIVLVMPDGERQSAVIACPPDVLAATTELPVTLLSGARYMSWQIERGVFRLGEAIPSTPSDEQGYAQGSGEK